MTIKLKPEQERYVREQVAAGRFPNEDAVVEVALRVFQLNDKYDEPIPDIPGGEPWTLETLRAAIQVGIDQADRGEFVESNADDIMRRVDEQLAREREQRKQKAG